MALSDGTELLVFLDIGFIAKTVTLGDFTLVLAGVIYSPILCSFFFCFFVSTDFFAEMSSRKTVESN